MLARNGEKWKRRGAYKAEKIDGLRGFHGKKAGRLVVIGPVNLPVTRLFVEEIISAWS